jgi:ribonuclease P protein component
MSSLIHFSFSKKERLCSDKAISVLFAKGRRLSRTVKGNTLRCVYLADAITPTASDTLAPAKILISVPKKNLKRAVDRNRIKRLIREGYRHKKDILLSGSARFHIAFVYQGSADIPFKDIEDMTEFFLNRIKDNCKVKQVCAANEHVCGRSDTAQ